MRFFFLAAIFASDAAAFIQFSCIPECQCLSDSIQYQCVVNNVLVWRIRDEDMTSLGTQTYTTSNDLAADFTPISGATQFSTDLSSTSPSIISNISFTVQSSINGYTIHCEDTGGDTKNCTVNVAAVLPPGNICVTATQTTLHITWTQTSHSFQCRDHYIVNTNITDYHTITTTDTSVNVSLTGLYPTTYCVNVASVDTANRTGEYSEEKCIELKVPDEPVVQYITIDSNWPYTYINVKWNFNGTIQPLLTAVYLSHNVTGSTTEEQLPSDEDEYNITTVNNGIYFVTIFGANALGNGSSNTAIIETGGTVIHPAASTYMQIFSSLPTCHSVDGNNGMLSSSVVAGITVAIAVPITAVITAIITVIIMYLCTTRHNNSKQSLVLPLVVAETPTVDLEMKSNAAYGQVINQEGKK